MNHPPIGGLSNLGPKDASGNRTYAMAEKLALGATAALAAWTAYAALTRKKAVVVRPSKTGPGFNEGVVAGRYLVSMQDHEGMAAVPGQSYEVAIRPLKGTDVESQYLLPFFKPSDVGLLAIGVFNIISIAFVALFVGLGVDFAIQFSVRYRSERHEKDHLEDALKRAGWRVGTPLALAAAATA